MAFTDLFSPIKPANAELKLPIINGIVLWIPIRKYNIMLTTTTKIPIYIYSVLRNCIAPCCMDLAICLIFSLPGDSFIILLLKMNMKTTEITRVAYINRMFILTNGQGISFIKFSEGFS